MATTVTKLQVNHGGTLIDVPASAVGAVAKTGDETIAGAKTFSSTIVGSVNGNAGTATKLANARNINISDSDSSNTGTAISFDGSSAGTIRLPSTIKATLTGNSSTATKLATARTINISDADSTNVGTAVSFDGSENGVVKLPSTIKASLTGNASTSTSLANNHAIDGVNFNGTSSVNRFAICGTSAVTTIKEITVNNFALVTGAVVYVKFTYANAATSPMLQVNSTTAAYIQYKGSTYTELLAGNSIYQFVYTGTYWELMGLVSSLDFLPLSGGTVTGNLTVGGALTGTLTGNATTATTAANYSAGGGIASALDSKLSLSGGTMSGALVTTAGIVSNKDESNYIASYNGTDYKISFESNHTGNRGLYDATAGKWIVCVDSDNATHIDGHLPLSGGTINGNLTVSNNITTTLLTRGTTSSELGVCGGTGYEDGGCVILYGQSSSIAAGEFRIRAAASGVTRDLIGTPNGSLTWRGDDVITSAGSSSYNCDGYIRYSNGLQICWGSFVHSSRTTFTTHNYPVSFTNGPFPLVSYGDTVGSGSEPLYTRADGENSYFKVATYNTGNVRVNYITVGWWK